MALGDLMESRFSHSQSQSSMVAVVANHLDRYTISDLNNSQHSSLNQSVVVVSDGVVDGNSDRDSSSDSVDAVQRKENHCNRDMDDTETVDSSASYYGDMELEMGMEMWW
ncbi:hypothetical protein QVD17_29274 [Tagetes erecta]|uniref:Uncharacterized protein n=1 Tax=Tagetes erecta TaxID=13708 RepID=A0AAD8NST1_TARER|nr:hypothetical protein QVD17_29274 [Tagetes erecta]